MTVRSIEGLIRALQQLQRAARGEDASGKRQRLPTAHKDIGDLFLAELCTRRRRLKAWLRVLHAAIECQPGPLPPPRCRRRPLAA